jgi:hypothetical protein
MWIGSFFFQNHKTESSFQEKTGVETRAMKEFWGKTPQDEAQNTRKAK